MESSVVMEADMNESGMAEDLESALQSLEEERMANEEQEEIKVGNISDEEVHRMVVLDKSTIACIPKDEQDMELQSLEFSMYEQGALERGLMDQLEQLTRGKDPETDSEQTERERKIRMGEMTPFGSTLAKGTTQETKVNDALTDFERYLMSQAELSQQRKVDADNKVKKKASDRKKKENQSQSDAVKPPVVPSCAEKEKRKRNPLNMRVLHPKKKPKRVPTGTWTSEDYRDARRKPGKVPGELAAMDPEGESGSEYVPSGSEEEAEEREVKRKKKSPKKKMAVGSSSDEWATDDSDWESSEDESKPRRRRRGLDVDDGNMKDYSSRIKGWIPEEEYEELEGGLKVPLRLWVQMYKYQRVGVRWLWELHQQGVGGILGDEMGLGKTLQVVAFLAALSFTKGASAGPVLVVCPATLLHQWVREFHHWWAPIRVAILHASGAYTGPREALIRSLSLPPSSGGGVLVTSYAGLVRHGESLLSRPWSCLVLDEGQRIRNPDAQATLIAKRFPTPHRILLSGSPLQNSLKELWSLMDFVFPGKLGTLPVFLQQFAVPITQGGYATSSQVQVATAYRCASVLRDTINPYLLRRCKDDVRSHLTLPGKNEQVLFCRLTEEQRSIYKEYLQSPEVHRVLGGRLQVFVGLLNLRKICNHPDLFTGGPKHFGSAESLESLPPQEKYGWWEQSGKMVVVEALLRMWKRQGQRVLLFSQGRQTLCVLENFVQQQGYSYLRMDGSTSVPSRQPLIARFNEDETVFVFLLTTRVGGLGINLTGANRVVIYDPDWNPWTDAQARERAWRIGQQRDVTVYRLLTSGTIEEKIFHRQVFKQFLALKVLRDPRQRRFFKANDLLELFTLQETDGDGTETGAIFAGMGSEVRPAPRRKQQKKGFSEAKVRAMRELARRLSQKIGQKGCSIGEASSSSAPEPPAANVEDGRKKHHRHHHHRKKPKEVLVEVEGESMPNVTGKEESVPDDEGGLDDGGERERQDEYVLRKLFAKSGVHSALKHDSLVGEGAADYALVEGEAAEVARRAVVALKKSRRQCWRPTDGVPTWTGRSGAPKPNKKPRFGGKHRGDSSIPSSSEILSQAIQRNRLLRPERAEGEEEDIEDGVATEPISPAEADLLADLRSFLAFRGSEDSTATTPELIREFKPRLPAASSALFKHMLHRLCTFRRDPESKQGTWMLRPEFRDDPVGRPGSSGQAT